MTGGRFLFIIEALLQELKELSLKHLSRDITPSLLELSSHGRGSTLWHSASLHMAEGFVRQGR